ncbi:tetratricopeptide repeat protein [Polynucleobacter sp. MWH-UH19D]
MAEFNKAIPFLEQTLKIEPKNHHALRFLGVIHAQQGNFDQAIKFINGSIGAFPKNGIAYSNLGNIYFQQGYLDKALEAYSKATKFEPNYAEAWSNKGNVLYELKRFEEALNHHDKAILLNPNYAEAWSNKGLVLHALKNYREALLLHRRSLEIQPHSPKLLVNKGITLSALHQHVEALKLYDQALAINPNYVEALSNKGSSLHELGQDQASLEQLENAISLNPQYAEAWYNKAITLSALKNYEGSLFAYQKAIDLRTNYFQAQWNKSLVELSLGNYTNGWRNFEARAFIENSPLNTAYNMLPRLSNIGDIKNKKILIWSEQGLGDTIQFCRFIPELEKLGANITFATPLTLHQTIRTLSQNINIVVEPENLNDYDFQLPLMSAPLLLRTDLESIPHKSPYIFADKAKSQAWSEKLKEFNQFRVGLVWSGGFRANQPELHAINEQRNIPLSTISTLQHLDRVTFFSLQKGDPAESELLRDKEVFWPKNNLINYASELKDFSDTAAFIENLDLVISVDTSTAHLAAALGKPTWILNRYEPCWRWLINKTDSPWYPTIRLYNQVRKNDWANVIESVMQDLKTKIASFN